MGTNRGRRCQNLDQKEQEEMLAWHTCVTEDHQWIMVAALLLGEDRAIMALHTGYLETFAFVPKADLNGLDVRKKEQNETGKRSPRKWQAPWSSGLGRRAGSWSGISPPIEN